MSTDAQHGFDVLPVPQASHNLLRQNREVLNSDADSRRRTISEFYDSHKQPDDDVLEEEMNRVMQDSAHHRPAPRETQPVKQAPEPRPRSMITHLEAGVSSLPQEEWSRMDATATLRRPRPPHHSDCEHFNLTETSTIKRRPKALAPPQSNGTDGDGPENFWRRPLSEACVGDGGRAEELHHDGFGSLPRQILKPPVSPKPAMALRKPDPPTPTRRVPLPGPEGQHSPGNKASNRSLIFSFFLTLCPANWSVCSKLASKFKPV